MRLYVKSGFAIAFAAIAIAGAQVLDGRYSSASAQAIESLLLQKIPVPKPNPRNVVPASVTQQVQKPAAKPIAKPVSSQTKAVSAGSTAKVKPVSGSLKSGMGALSKKDAKKALAIRAGMPAGSLQRKVLAWSIALSGLPGIPSADIANIASDLPDWPGQKTMRRNAEAAMARARPSPRSVINAFNGNQPESLAGGMLLADAYLATGNKKAARAAIAPFWRNDRLSQSTEKTILKKYSNVLTRDDHRFRMHMQFYRERSKGGMRMAPLAEQVSLAKARAAVITNSKNADKLLASVAPSSRRDVAYQYAKIKRARRTGDTKKAAKLMLAAPKDQRLLVNPDEWWIERRLISRQLLDMGDAKTAYKIAAGHAAESASKRAEAEFHAGWYALRFLKNPRLARTHFQNILNTSVTPISQARGYYWLARASSGADAQRHYKSAAQHGGTFYGQLAAQELGQRRLSISNPRPSASERTQFANRELVKAIELLEKADYGWRAEIIYRELASSLNSAGELAMLAARAEKQGKHTLALQIGKIGHRRGLDVDTVSWPIGAIPKRARIGDTGLALAYSIARQESAFNAKAISPAKARGLLQLLPGTAKLMAKKVGVKYSKSKLTSDPAYNARLGAAYLSEQLDNFSNSYILTFVGYNAGPGRAKDWIKKYGDPRSRPIHEVIDWIERIPFTETRNYVQRVMENYQVYKSRISKKPFDIERDLRFGRT
ncbi:MAG: lytic transglycosylase domain-containing protein [Pseudomonadota bacterium]